MAFDHMRLKNCVWYRYNGKEWRSECGGRLFVKSARHGITFRRCPSCKRPIRNVDNLR